jgi:hypothetical protein
MNDTNITPATSPATKDATEEARREAARLMGRARTPAKIEAARRNAPINGLLGGRPRKSLSEIPCNCGRGDSLEGHPTSCLRGLAIRRRQKAAQ